MQYQQYKGYVFTALLALSSIVVGYVGGTNGATNKPVPSVLSIDAVDRAWITDLYREARSRGECVHLEPLPLVEGEPRRYWLHSCYPVEGR